jgi:hypothetical protein
MGFRCQVSGFSPPAGLKNGQFDGKETLKKRTPNDELRNSFNFIFKRAERHAAHPPHKRWCLGATSSIRHLKLDICLSKDSTLRNSAVLQLGVSYKNLVTLMPDTRNLTPETSSRILQHDVDLFSGGFRWL